MQLEEKWAIALGVLSIVLLAVGWGVAKAISVAPNSVARVMIPLAAAVTLLTYLVFVFIARVNVKG